MSGTKKEAVLVVKTLDVLCPVCGTGVGPMKVGATEWTPTLAKEQFDLQKDPAFSPVAHAPMCSGCGEFLTMPRPARQEMRLQRPNDLPCPEGEKQDHEGWSPCCGAALEYVNDYRYRCKQCGKVVNR